jgi:hypothetical protein
MIDPPAHEKTEPPQPAPSSELAHPEAGATPPPQFVGYRVEVLQRLEDWPFGDSAD